MKMISRGTLFPSAPNSVYCKENDSFVNKSNSSLLLKVRILENHKRIYKKRLLRDIILINTLVIDCVTLNIMTICVVTLRMHKRILSGHFDFYHCFYFLISSYFLFSK